MQAASVRCIRVMFYCSIMFSCVLDLRVFERKRLRRDRCTVRREKIITFFTYPILLCGI